VGGARSTKPTNNPNVLYTRAGATYDGPGKSPSQAQPSFNDASWDRVNLPHDSIIAQIPSNETCTDGCSGKSYLPRPISWYRKTFKIPSDWVGSTYWLQFEGVFRETVIYLNGQNISSHDCGYTGFSLRLDNQPALDESGINTLAVYVNPSQGDQGSADHGSGWWYEGGGIYRHVSLVQVSRIHIEQDGVFAYSNITSPVQRTKLLLQHGIAAAGTPEEGLASET